MISYRLIRGSGRLREEIRKYTDFEVSIHFVVESFVIVEEEINY